jgi:hypothetical protein
MTGAIQIPVVAPAAWPIERSFDQLSVRLCHCAFDIKPFPICHCAFDSKSVRLCHCAFDQ